MRKFIFSLVAIVLVLLSLSCDKKDAMVSPAPGELAYFIFGHFYGECGGEGCIEIYKLENERLWEDTTDVYPTSETPYDGIYISLPKIKYELVKDIIDYFPEELYNETVNYIGQPDAGDWGGIYVEIKYVDAAAKSGFWLLDQNSSNMPDVYNNFVTRINEKIILINQ